jgi:hypothetical protein
MCLRLKKISPKVLDGTVYILATSTTCSCLNCGVLSVSNTVLFMYIDWNFSEQPSSSIFIVCVTLPLIMVAAVTTWEKQQEHTLCLIMWQEFFGSLRQSGFQNFAQQHLDTKFRAVGSVSLISVRPDNCYSEECMKMGMSYKTGVLRNFRYVIAGTSCFIWVWNLVADILRHRQPTSVGWRCLRIGC